MGEEAVRELVNDDQDRSVVLLALSQDLAELSEKLQDQIDAGVDYFEWEISPSWPPNPYNKTKRWVLTFMLLEVLQAAGFEASTYTVE